MGWSLRVSSQWRPRPWFGGRSGDLHLAGSPDISTSSRPPSSVYTVAIPIVHLGLVDVDLWSSPGRLADTAATYCPSSKVEYLKLKPTQPRCMIGIATVYNSSLPSAGTVTLRPLSTANSDNNNRSGNFILRLGPSVSNLGKNASCCIDERAECCHLEQQCLRCSSYHHLRRQHHPQPGESHRRADVVWGADADDNEDCVESDSTIGCCGGGCGMLSCAAGAEGGL